MPVLLRSSLRHYRRHPLQGALAVLGIALGVAVVVSVDLAIASSQRAFERSTEAAFGRATHQIVAGPEGIPDSVYRALRVGLGIEAAPVVEARVRVAQAGARTRVLSLFGVDPFAEPAFRPWAGIGDGAVPAATMLTRPGALVMPDNTAAALGLLAGDSLTVEVGSHRRTAWIAALVPVGGIRGADALGDFVLADIATAQELAGRVRRIDRIDVRVTDSAAIARVRTALPPGSRLIETRARSAATLGMTRAFSINLTAFALIVLVFGALLIYDTMTFSIVQRRTLIGLMRAIGVTRGQIFRLLLGEALVLGAVATALGIGLGVVLGSGLVRLVARTINDLYFTVSVTGVTVGARSLARGIALGIGATVLAAIPPLRDATSTPPRATLSRSLLEDASRLSSRRAALAGSAAFAFAIALLALPGRSIAAGFAALFAIVMAGALLAPAGTVLIMRAIRPAAAKTFGVAGSIAVRGVTNALSRTGPAIAALMVAISVGAAVGIMVGSFRHSVERWLDTSLQADLYVAAASPGARGEGDLPDRLTTAVAALPGIDGISALRQTSIPFGSGDLSLVAAAFHPRHRGFFTFLDAGRDAWAAFDDGAILVSEAFAFRNAVDAGDTVPLVTGRGVHGFPVAAIFRDYASEFGVVFIARDTYDQWWDDPAVSSLAIFVEPGADVDAVAERIRSIDAGDESAGLSVRSNRGLREATLEVFDRTFVITGVLRMLALIVAFVGVLSALMALQLERSRELGVMRAAGMTPRQLWALVSAQTSLMGLAAGLLAAPLAIALAWMLIHVINRRSFGWTLLMHIDAGSLSAALALALGAAFLAGLWPAWRMARTPPAAALREE